MSDASARTAADTLKNIWSAFADPGYTLTDDREIGLPAGFRHRFLRTYFNDTVLRHDPGDLPVDRKRARDVIRYQWRDGHLHLQEFDRITITDRADIPGKREHARVMLLEDPQAEGLVRTFLELVPPDLRRADGTLGVNLFRTFTDVVTKPHRDNEQFVMLYVLDRVGDGAESYLYNSDDVLKDRAPTAAPVFKHELTSGEIIIFDDQRFKHGATPLEAPPGGNARRDVLVCTVDDPTTYLAPSA